MVTSTIRFLPLDFLSFYFFSLSALSSLWLVGTPCYRVALSTVLHVAPITALLTLSSLPDNHGFLVHSPYYWRGWILLSPI
jgi:hypothetical protein